MGNLLHGEVCGLQKADCKSVRTRVPRGEPNYSARQPACQGIRINHWSRQQEKLQAKRFVTWFKSRACRPGTGRKNVEMWPPASLLTYSPFC